MGHVLHRCGVGVYGVLALVMWLAGASDAWAAPVCFLDNVDHTYTRGPYTNRSAASAACQAEYDQRTETECIGHSGCKWLEEEQRYKMVLRNSWGYLFIHLYPVEESCPESGTPGPVITVRVGELGEGVFAYNGCLIEATAFHQTEYPWGLAACYHVVGAPESETYCEYETTYTGGPANGEPVAPVGGGSGEREDPENGCPENFSWNGESCEANDTNNPQDPPTDPLPETPTETKTTTEETTTTTTTNPDGSVTTTTTTTTTTSASGSGGGGSTSTTTTTTTTNPDGSSTQTTTKEEEGPIDCFKDPSKCPTGGVTKPSVTVPVIDEAPEIGESVEGLMSGIQDAPIYQAIAGIALPTGTGSCPALGFDFFGQTVGTDLHCQLAEQWAFELFAVMMAVYTLGAVRIIASA